MIFLLDFDLTLTTFSVTDASKSASAALMFKPYVRDYFKGFVNRQNRLGNSVVILSFNTTPIIEQSLGKLGITNRDVEIVTPEMYEKKSGLDAHLESMHRHHERLGNMKVRFADELVRNGVPRSEIAFFDDNRYNVEAMARYGVPSFLVPPTAQRLDPIRMLLTDR